MTDKEQNERYWLIGVEDSILTANALFKEKIYHHALFYCQLAIEKQLKALIVKNLNRAAPTIHDLVELANIAKISRTTTQNNQLHDITDFNLAARYDSGFYNFKQKATRKYFFAWYKITKEVLLWLAKL
jgi:HEPN domain-containing protein